MKEVAGRVAFVTGGASGLGLAMARSFSAAGMKVAIADVQKDALDAAIDSFSESNAEVIGLRCDVTDRNSMMDARNETLKAFGKVHVVCNNAGVARNGNIADMTFADWDWVMKVNVDGVINGLVTFLDDIRGNGEGGHIVNTASIAGQYGLPRLGVYCASKFAVVGMSETMRLDLAADNIGVSVLCPGVVETGIGQSERNRPEEYGGTSAPAMTPREDGQESSIEMDIMQPQVIGDMVLHAIQNNIFYILSHAEFQPMIAARGEEIAGAFDLWKAWRDAHGT